MFENLPKKIWFLWYQGIENCPYVVKKCLESWQRHNPDWEITILENKNLQQYVDLNLPKKIESNLNLTHISDLIRLEVLIKYGGVWVDSTCYCNKPLKKWLAPNLKSGIFMFSRPMTDRLISNWFIASDRNNYLLKQLNLNLRRYWLRNKFKQHKPWQEKLHWRIFNLLTQVKQTKHWFNPIVTKVLRIYPYFIFHYTFNQLVRKDPLARKIWWDMPDVDAPPANEVAMAGFHNPVTPEVVDLIKDETIPIHKLSYKYDHTLYAPGQVLYYLLEQC